MAWEPCQPGLEAVPAGLAACCGFWGHAGAPVPAGAGWAGGL